MIVDLIPHDPPRRNLDASYKLRGRFWLTSVIAHILWVAVVVRIPLSVPASKRPIYEQFIRPLEARILVYRPPKKPAQAAPETQVGKSKDARGRLTAPRAVIATAKNAQSQKQMVWKPVNLPEVKLDVPAPTVVARVETALPPPPKLAPKQFIAPERQAREAKRTPAEITAALAAAPAVAVQNDLSNAKTALPPPPKTAPKQFVPPPQSPQQPKLATRTEVTETLTASAAPANTPTQLVPTTAALPPAPKRPVKQFTAPQAAAQQAKQARATEVTAQLSAVPQVSSVTAAPIPSLVFSRVPGPPKEAPVSPEATRGNDQVNVAIASVNPAPAVELPANPRSGQFSVAPLSGEPAGGAAAPGALTIPNLTVRDPAPPVRRQGKSNTVLYTERVRASYSSVFTVPLRPSNRSIPRSVEAHFGARSVYAVVIPIENLPAYGTDWILWFSENNPPAGPVPSVRPPVPVRKIELVENSREPNDTRLQIAASLSADGKLSNVKVLSAVSAAVQALAIEDLTSWEWKPATRNNAAVAIEAVFEIPFRLALRN